MGDFREIGSDGAQEESAAAKRLRVLLDASAPAPLDTPDRAEGRFQSWYGDVTKKLNAKKRTIDPDPDAPEHFYDYRAFHRDLEAGKPIKPPSEPGGHWDSDYKTEGHPRTYLPDSAGKMFDTRSGEYVVGGAVPKRELARDIPESEERPGFDPKKAKMLATLLSALRGR